MENKQYLSSRITLCDIVYKNILFNIPIYQRLYVWKELQVNKLLEDIFDAYRRNEDNYYLGGVVTYSNGDKLDLIDGQQRFTTLWLICMVISSMEQNVCDEMKCFCGNEQKLRIQFAIRPQITKFLISHLEKDKSNDNEVKQVPDVENMLEAIGNIKVFCESIERKKYLIGFASFIMERVVLVRTEIPAETDLNKLFELINGRGQQLSQTDILKSHILNLIRKETKDNEDLLIRYGQIWNACADMNEYVEYNIQQEDPSLTWKDRLKYDKKFDGNEEGIVADFGNDFFDKYIQTPVNDNFIDQPESLFNIVLNSSVKKDGKEYNKENNSHTNSNGREVRSIVSFQMLLLYTLRIFLIENKLRIYGKNERYDIDFFNEKSLLKIFEPAIKRMDQDKSAQAFIKLLWMVRVLFDKNVVKWIKEDGETEEVLTIRTLRISIDKRNGNLRVHRDSVNSITEMTQLQSILYFSQPRIYELWLCPFLYNSFSENDPNDLLKYLQQLDNVLLCLPYESCQDMLWRTYEVMTNGLGNHNGNDFYNYFCQIAEQEEGCNFAHYLFYKMEYMLWWKNKLTKERSYWDTYRLSSKNSVEHINPQTPKYNQSQISYLNTFGNLVLVSREVNSSYSNKSFKEKQAQFIDKRDNGHQIDSLKSDVIYSTVVEEWGDSECKQHLFEMEKIAYEYFHSTADDYHAISDESNLIRKWVSKAYRDNKIQLLAAVFARATDEDIRFDAGSGYFRLPNEEEISQFPFIGYLYEQRNHLSDSTEGIDLDEFVYPENYYFAKYPNMINNFMQGKYYSDDYGRIVMVYGQRKGIYNYKEVLLCILCTKLENDSFEVVHWGDTLFLYIYFDGNRFSITQQDEQSEYITFKCWYDYEKHSMLYEIEVNNDNNHRGLRTRILRANNWVFNNDKRLFLDSRPELHHFHSNRDLESIAMKCERDIRDIVKKILRYE